MRFPRLLVAASLALACVACGDPASAQRSDGALVLEVGGEQPSLREALITVGALPREPVQPPPNEHPPRTSRGETETPPQRPTDPAIEAPVDGPPNPAAGDDSYFLVELEEEQTLIHVAKKHLGDGNRFRELLELNGWSEADARRLQVGQKVKVPRQRGAAPVRR